MTRTEPIRSKSAKSIHQINHYQVDKYCVVPENIHTPHTEGNRFRGEGGSQRRHFPIGGCLQRFFLGGLSKIGELLINNSFPVEQFCFYFFILLLPMFQNKYDCFH